MDLLLTIFRLLLSWLWGGVPELRPVLVQWHGAGVSGTCQIDPPWVVSPLLNRIAEWPRAGAEPAAVPRRRRFNLLRDAMVERFRVHGLVFQRSRRPNGGSPAR
jgi:hypothetical protein